MKTPSFSHIVSGAEPVAHAFDLYPPTRLWWRVILWLHGKPTAPTLTEEERREIVADGFRFYAQLYRFLSAIFWMLGGACWFGGIFETSHEAAYWTGASVMTGCFLWFASGLGFVGAKALRECKSSARLLLCAFMVAVISFLSALVATLSVVAHLQLGQNIEINLGMAGLVWLVGIGSYLIEVLYLVSETRLDPGI